MLHRNIRTQLLQQTPFLQWPLNEAWNYFYSFSFCKCHHHHSGHSASMLQCKSREKLKAKLKLKEAWKALNRAAAVQAATHTVQRHHHQHHCWLPLASFHWVASLALCKWTMREIKEEIAWCCNESNGPVFVLCKWINSCCCCCPFWWWLHGLSLHCFVGPLMTLTYDCMQLQT